MLLRDRTDKHTQNHMKIELADLTFQSKTKSQDQLLFALTITLQYLWGYIKMMRAMSYTIVLFAGGKCIGCCCRCCYCCDRSKKNGRR